MRGPREYVFPGVRVVRGITGAVGSFTGGVGDAGVSAGGAGLSDGAFSVPQSPLPGTYTQTVCAFERIEFERSAFLAFMPGGATLPVAPPSEPVVAPATGAPAAFVAGEPLPSCS